MKKSLSEPAVRFAILASTNVGVARTKRRLDRGSEAYRLYPQSSSLAFGDTIFLQYGRLMLELLRTHWITGRVDQVGNDTVAVLLVLLFQEQDKTTSADPGAWGEFAQVLLDTAHGQRKPGQPRDWRNRLEGNLSTLNEMLRATQEKQREKGVKNPHSTPFDRGDTPLLEILRDEFIASIAKNVDTGSRLDIKRAEVSFERASQQKVIFEKLGIQKNVQVMTIHKSKGREFDGVVLVLENSPKAIWRESGNASDEEIEDLYRVAISRARSAFALVAFEDAWEDAAEPVRRLLPKELFHRNG